MAVASGSTLSVRLTLTEAETFKSALQAIATDGAGNLQVLQGVVQKLAADFVALTDKQSLSNKAATENATRVRESAVSYTQLKAGLDPVYGALVKLQQQEDIVNTARARGTAGIVDAANTMRLANEQYQATIVSLNLMGGAWGMAQKAAKENAAAFSAASTTFAGVRDALDPVERAFTTLTTQLKSGEEALRLHTHTAEEVEPVMNRARASYTATVEDLARLAAGLKTAAQASAETASAFESASAKWAATKASVDPATAAFQTYQAALSAGKQAVDLLGESQESVNRTLALAKVRYEGALEALLFVDKGMEEAARKTAATQAANTALSSSYAALKSGLDPVYAATIRYEEGLALVNRAVEAKQATEEDAARTTGLVIEAHQEAIRGLGLMSNAWNLSEKAARENAAAFEVAKATFSGVRDSLDPMERAFTTLMVQLKAGEEALRLHTHTAEEVAPVMNRARAAYTATVEDLARLAAGLLTTEQILAKNTAAIESARSTWAGLKSSVDPAEAALQSYRAALAAGKQAVDVLGISQEEVNRTLALAKTRYEGALDTLSGVGKALEEAARKTAAADAANAALAASYVSLKAGLDPSFAALVRYNDALALVQRAVASKATTEEDAARTTGLLTAAHEKTVFGLNQMAAGFAQAQREARAASDAVAAAAAAFSNVRDGLDPAARALTTLNAQLAAGEEALRLHTEEASEVARVMALAKAAYAATTAEIARLSSGLDEATRKAAAHAAEMTSAAASWAATKQGLDPMTAALAAYDRVVVAAAQAVDNLGVSQEEANRWIALAEVKYDDTQKSLLFLNAAMAESARKTEATAAANAALGVSFDRLRAATDPLFAATMNLAAAEATLGAAVASGERPAETAKTVLANLRKEYDLVVASLVPMGNAEALAAKSADMLAAAQARTTAEFQATWAAVDPMRAAIAAYEQAVQRAMAAVAQDKSMRADANAMLAAAKVRYDQVYASMSATAQAQRKLTEATEAAVKEEGRMQSAYASTKSAIDRVFAAEQTRLTQQSAISKARAAGHIDDAQQVIDLAQVDAAYDKSTETMNRHGHAMNRNSTLNAGALQELIVLAHEMVTGNFSRMPGSMMVFAEMTGGLVEKLQAVVRFAKSTTGIITGVIASVAAVGVAAVVAYELQVSRLNTLQQHLRATRLDYMALGETIEKAAKAAAVSVPGLSNKDAKESSEAIFSVPEFTGAKVGMVELLELATNLAKVMNKEVPEAAKVLAASFRSPGEEAKKLADDGFAGLSYAMAHNIEMMEKSGDKTGATAALFAILKDRTAGAAVPVTDFGKAIEALAKGFDRLQQAMGPMLRDIGGPMTQALAGIVDGLTKTLEAYTKIKNASKETDATGLAARILLNLKSGEGIGAAVARAISDQLISGGTSAASSGTPGARTPGKAPVEGEKGWRPGNVLGNTESSATGLFQITDATATSLGVNSLDYADNIRGGVKRILAAWQTWNGDVTAVAKAYEQGDEGLRRINTGRALQTSVTEAARYAAKVETANPANLPAKVTQDITAEASRQGADPAQLNLMLKVAMVESSGQHWDTRATASQTTASGAVVGGRATAMGAYDFKPTTEINDATKTAIAVPTPEATKASLAATMQALQAQKDALLAVGASGQQVYKELGAEGTTSLHLITDALTALTGTAYKTRTPLEEIEHQLLLTAKTGESTVGMERELAKLDQQIREAAKGMGLEEIPAAYIDKMHALLTRTQDQATLDATMESSRRKADEAVVHWASAKAALEALTPSGKMLFETMGEAGAVAYRKVNEGLNAVSATAYKTRTPVDEIIHGLEQTALTATKSSGIVRDLAKLDVSLNEAAMASTGKMATDAQLAAAHVSFLATQFQTVADGSSQEARRSIDAKVKYWAEAKAKMEAITEGGKPLWQTEEGGADKYRIVTEGLQVLQGQSYKTRDAVQEVLHSLELQAVTAGVASGATLDLAKSDAVLNEAAKGLGLSGASAADLEAGRVLTLKNLDRGFRDQIDTMERTTEGQVALTASLVAGGAATDHLTNKIKAQEEARKVAGETTEEYRVRVAALTATMDRNSQATNDAAVQRTTLNATMQTEYIRAEIASLGMNSEKRAILLAQLQEELTLRQSLKPVSEAQRAAAILAVTEQATAQAELTRNTQAFADVSSELSSMFTTVGNSISDAFTKGSSSGVTFKSVMQGLETQLIQFIFKLGVLNPLLKSVFSQDLTTINTLGDAISSSTGNASSGGTSSTSSTSSMSTDLGILSTVWKGANWLTDGALSNFASGAWADVGGKALVDGFASNFSSLFSGAGVGMGAFGSVAADAGAVIGTGVQAVGVIGGEAAIGAGIGTGAAMGEAAGSIAAAAGESASAAGSIASSIGSLVGEYIPYIGAAIGAIIAISKGDYKGAAEIVGFTTAGALIGTYVFPVIGTAAGAAIGAIVGTIASMLGPGPENPYSATAIDVANGKLSVGKTVSAKTDTSQIESSTHAWVDVINNMNDMLGLTLANGVGQLASVGSNIADYKQTLDLGTLFQDLRFNSKSQETNLGIAENKLLPTKSFADATELGAFLVKIASLTDGLDALGIKLGGVEEGVDGWKNIWIAGVEGTSAFSTALKNDLGKQAYDTQADLEAEISKVYTFVEQTLPGLVGATGHAISSFMQGVADINTTYAEAEAQAKAYGLSIDGLVATQAKLIDQQAVIAEAAIDASKAGLQARILSATGQTGAAELLNFDAAVPAAKKALEQIFLDYYGEAGLQMKEYADQSLLLDQALAAERLNIQKKYNADTLALTALTSSNDNLQLRVAALEPTQERHDLLAFDQGAADELAKARTDLAAAGLAVADVARQISAIEAVQGAERVAIVAKYSKEASDAMEAALTTAKATEATARDAYVAAIDKSISTTQSNTTALVSVATGLHTFIKSLATSEQSPLTPGDQLYAAKNKFVTDLVSAKGGNQTAAGALSGDATTMLDKAATYYGKASSQYADLFRETTDQLNAAEGYYITAAMIAQQTLDVETAIAALVRDGNVSITALNDAIQQAQAGNMAGLDALAKTVTGVSAVDVAALGEIKAVIGSGNAGNIISLEGLRGAFIDTGLGNIAAIDKQIAAATAAGNGVVAVVDIVTATLIAGNAIATSAVASGVDVNTKLSSMIEVAQAAKDSGKQSFLDLIEAVVSGDTDTGAALSNLNDGIGRMVDYAKAHGTSLADMALAMFAQEKASAEGLAQVAHDVSAKGDNTTSALSVLQIALIQAGHDDATTGKTAIDIMRVALVEATATAGGQTAEAIGTLRDNFAAAQAATALAAANAAVAKIKAAADDAVALQKAADAAKALADSLAKAQAAAAAAAANTPVAAPAETATSKATATVTADYQEMLGRAPDAPGLANYVNMLLGGSSNAAVKSNIAGSAEYLVRQDFITLLGRAPDAAGLAFWVNALNAGANNSAVIASIKAGTEYKALHGLAEGGWVGNGVWNKDSVVASFAGGGGIGLAGGEYVMNATSAARYAHELPEMNAGRRPLANDNSAESAALRKEVAALRVQVAQLIQITAAGHLSTRDAVQAGNAMTASGLAIGKMRASR